MLFSFFTNTAREIVQCHIYPFAECIQRLNWHRQPHNNHLSQQFAYQSCFYGAKCLPKAHSVSYQCFWYIQIPNPPSHNEPYCPNLVHLKTRFQAGLAMNRCCQKLGFLSIGKSDRHWTAWAPHQETYVESHSRLFWEQCSILNWDYLDWGTSRQPLGSEVHLLIGWSPVRPHWSLLGALR